MHKISVAKDFSRTPGGRVRSDGEFSAEEFLDKVLRSAFDKAWRAGETLLVLLDGTYGYSTGFLEQAFGGLARELGSVSVEAGLEFVSKEEPYLVDDIKGYIRDVDGVEDPE